MRASSVKVLFTVLLLLSTVIAAAGADDTTEADDGAREGDWIPDPRMRALIKNVTDNVTEDYIYSKIESLTDFGTRYTHSIQNPKAVQWIQDELEGYGYMVEKHNFTHHATPGISNVIATLPGTGAGGIIIICAHLDSTNWPESWNFPETTAPGADDDATGVAVVLAAAKVLSQYRFDQEIRFIGFNAEELSKAVGSTHYSENVSLKGEDLNAVLNIDMIGYNDNYIYEEVVYDVPSHYIFTDFISPVNEEFHFIDTLNAVETQNNPNSWGDIEPFWNRGYKGVTFAESDSPRFNSSFYKAKVTTFMHYLLDRPLSGSRKEHSMIYIAIFNDDVRSWPYLEIILNYLFSGTWMFLIIPFI